MTEAEHTQRCRAGIQLEDTTFALQLAACGVGRRRFECVAGHSIYVEAPELVIEDGYPADGHRRCAACHGVLGLDDGLRLHVVCMTEGYRVKSHRRVCAQCQTRSFETTRATSQRRYCDECLKARKSEQSHRGRRPSPMMMEAER